MSFSDDPHPEKLPRVFKRGYSARVQQAWLPHMIAAWTWARQQIERGA